MKVALLAAMLLCGCAVQGSIGGICAVAPMQSNQQGVAYFRYACEPDKVGQ